VRYNGGMKRGFQFRLRALFEAMIWTSYWGCLFAILRTASQYFLGTSALGDVVAWFLPPLTAGGIVAVACALAGIPRRGLVAAAIVGALLVLALVGLMTTASA
jgi:hypothetical protein